MGRTRRPLGAVASVVLLAGLMAGGAGQVATSAAAAEVPASVTYTGGDLQPVTPARVLDTRSGIGAPTARLGPGGVVSVKVTGVAGVPAVGVDSVVLNLTGIAPTGGTYLTVWPHGEQRPVASSLNLKPGEVRPNLVAVKVGRDGLVDIYNYNGQVNLAADVSGWFPVASGLRSVTPARILDTRTGLGAPKAPVGPGHSLALQVTGRGGVPADGVSAVVVNLTGVAPTAGETYLTAWPAGQARPIASNLNLRRGDVAANLAVVKVGETGQIGLFNYSGNVNVVADVVGWFSTDSAYEPLTPARVLDTRKGIGSSAGSLGGNSTLHLKVTGVGGVPSSGVGAVVLNLTGIAPTGSSTYVTGWPSGVAKPVASNLNLTRGTVIPNLVVVKVGTGGIVNLYNYYGRIHLAADVVGWFPTGTSSSTSMTPKADTVLVGPGDITAITPPGPDGTGGVATLSASADVPQIGGHFAYVGGPGGDPGASGIVTAVTVNPDGTATITFSTSNLQDLFDDLELHIDQSGSHAAQQQQLQQRGGSAGQGSVEAPLTGATGNGVKRTAGAASGDEGPCSVGGAPLSLPLLTYGGFHGSADFSLRHGTARIEMGGALSMTWSAEVTGSVSCQLTLGEAPIGWIGPVEIGWEVGETVSISAAVNASASVNVPINVGFAFDNGDVSNLSDATINGNAQGDAEAVLSAEFSAGLTTKLFGIVGVKAALAPGLDLTVERQSETPPVTCVTLDARVSLGIEAEVKKWGVGWSFSIAESTLASGNLYRSPECRPMQWSGTISVDDYYQSVCIAGDQCSGPINWSKRLTGDFTLIHGTDDGFGYEVYLSNVDATASYSEFDRTVLDTCTVTTQTDSTTTYPGIDRVGLVMKRSGSNWVVGTTEIGTDPVESLGESGQATFSGTSHTTGCGSDETTTPEITYSSIPFLRDDIVDGVGIALVDDDPALNHLVGTTHRTLTDPNPGANFAGTETITFTYDLTRVPVP